VDSAGISGHDRVYLTSFAKNGMTKKLSLLTVIVIVVVIGKIMKFGHEQLGDHDNDHDNEYLKK
jgi:hypothetical protein